MASNINPTNIDGNFPVAGQDNDSQGFRDNFTNIKTNLQFAQAELNDLQNKAILKSALIGGTLTNDLNNAVLYRPQLKAPTQTFRYLGAINGSIPISFLDAGVQKVTTGGPLIIGLDDFPATGFFGSMRLWIRVTFGPSQTAATVTWPNSVTLGTGKIDNLNFETRQMTFAAAGDYLYELSTVDGGANFWIVQLA